MSEEDKNSGQQAAAETETAGTEGQNNNTSTGSQAAKTEKTGTPETVPYSRFKEVNDKLKELEGKSADKKPSTALTDSPVDTVLEVVGKVPEHLKPEMRNIANYAAEHKMPVEDVIALWNVKTGNTVPKAEVDKFNKANAEANDSRTGGTANPAVRYETEFSKMSDAELKAQAERDLA